MFIETKLIDEGGRKFDSFINPEDIAAVMVDPSNADKRCVIMMTQGDQMSVAQGALAFMERLEACDVKVHYLPRLKSVT